jgi:hypothetical protein
MANKDENTVVYCGGCGHLYFNEPKVSLARAEEIAKTLRCTYCIEDAAEERRYPQQSTPLGYQTKDDGFTFGEDSE